MIQNHSFHLQKLTSGDAVAPRRQRPARSDMPKELRQYIAALGPMPKNTLETFVDLSLSDDEIARYFQVPASCISQLRRIWNIHA